MSYEGLTMKSVAKFVHWAGESSARPGSEKYCKHISAVLVYA
jgi:hypothetical protein